MALSHLLKSLGICLTLEYSWFTVLCWFQLCSKVDHLYIQMWEWSRSVVPDSVRPHGLQPIRLFCPWDFPGKDTGVGFLLQGIFPTQGSNPGLLHCRQILYWLSYKGRPILIPKTSIKKKQIQANISKLRLYWIYRLLWVVYSFSLYWFFQFLNMVYFSIY